MRPYSGMDLSQFRDRIGRLFPKLEFVRHDLKVAGLWQRLWFGFTQSPEGAALFYYLAEEFIRGNRLEKDNPLRWDEIVLNLVGNTDYNPALPHVFKWDSTMKRISGDLVAYVDDLRAIGFSLEAAWAIAQRIASRIQYLGVQDAPRKRRIDNGPWAGGIYSTSGDIVTKTVTQQKWDKGKRIIQTIYNDIKATPGKQINYKRLERERGFLCHLAMVYSILFPFLKGYHLTLSSHLPNRDIEGWKINELEYIASVEGDVEEGRYTREEADIIVDRINSRDGLMKPPDTIALVPRFLICLEALKSLMDNDLPPVVTVRSAKVILLIYGFGNTSVSGFGLTLYHKGSVHYTIGTWSSSEDTNSSNWREFENLVCCVEEAGSKGWLLGATLILATDNLVTESALYKGNSTSKHLLELIVRLRKSELK